MAAEPNIEFDPGKAVEVSGNRGTFDGVIINSKAGLRPANEEKSIKAGHTLEILIKADTKDWKPLHEWYNYSDDKGKATTGKGSKWMNFLAMLTKTGAYAAVDRSGATNQERMDNFAKSLVGMHFTFRDFSDLPRNRPIEEILEAEAKGKPIQLKEKEQTTRAQILPIKYLGKVEVSGDLKSTTVSEFD